jgi:cellulose synthase (UDP-forming)
MSRLLDRTRQRWISPEQARLWRDRCREWVVDYFPQKFDNWLGPLNRWQLGLMVLCLFVLYMPLITLRLSAIEQGIVAALFIGVGVFLVKLEDDQPDAKTSEAIHLFLLTISSLTTLRYFYYRSTYTLNFDGILNSIFTILLYIAEVYAILTLFLSYFQTLKINDRKPVDLSLIPEAEWPKVDIYIPTYNEDVEIVRKTALGALAIDYPKAKKRVYILDDGRAEKYRDRRQELYAMGRAIGVEVLVRDSNEHAKAGNINTALPRTGGDLVLILDCDHIPSRSLLQNVVGFFRNPKVALVQTPHWFYNPDPFERNLLTGGQVPVGNELFYKVLQKGNDYWNAAFFCGSAAVIRRDYLLKIGGIATETVTEDCHTSLRLHSLGYETIYYDKIMIAGLAPEKFSAYVGQQVRWARGMAQILRLENPLFNRKLNLTLSQRICYFSATSHFFFGFPRLMYVIAPMLYLLMGINPVKGLGFETLFYALPHILLSMQTNHIPYKHVRFSFWNEIYEFVMSFQAGLVTLLALVNPNLGTFNVTDKGLTVTKRSFDFEAVRYLLILGVLTAASLAAMPFWLILSPPDTQAVLINALWCVFNLLLVLAACLVAFEQPQLRTCHRLPRVMPIVLHSDSLSLFGHTENISESGALLLLEEWPNIADEVRLEVTGDYGAKVLVEAKIVRAIATPDLKTQVALEFINLNQTQKDDLAVLLFSDVDEWYSQSRGTIDNPIDSLRFIASSLRRVFQEFQPQIGMKVRQQVQAPVQLSWEIWGDCVYSGTLVEMGSREMRLELRDDPFIDVPLLQEMRPILGLLVHPWHESEPQSLLAQVQSIDRIDRIEGDSTLAIELLIPESLRRSQRSKVRRLLKALSL